MRTKTFIYSEPWRVSILLAKKLGNLELITKLSLSVINLKYSCGMSTMLIILKGNKICFYYKPGIMSSLHVFSEQKTNIGLKMDLMV